MAKYYVTSGSLRQIVQANDPQSASLWAMHLAMEQILPLDDIDWLDDDCDLGEDYVAGMKMLDREVQISELGYGRSDSGRFDTRVVLTEWNQLLVALAKFEEVFGESPTSTASAQPRD